MRKPDSEGPEGAADEAVSGGAAARAEALFENMGWQIPTRHRTARHSPRVSRR